MEYNAAPKTTIVEYSFVDGTRILGIVRQADKADAEVAAAVHIAARVFAMHQLCAQSGGGESEYIIRITGEGAAVVNIDVYVACDDVLKRCSDYAPLDPSRTRQRCRSL